MFTSDINKRFLKASFIYLSVSLFLVLFGAVYEANSHGVYSYFMIYAFCIPLVFGTLVYFIRALLSGKDKTTDASDMLYCGFIAAFTVGSVIKGVLEIYGTTNRNTYIYAIAGAVLLAAAGLYKMLNYRRRRK